MLNKFVLSHGEYYELNVTPAFQIANIFLSSKMGPLISMSVAVLRYIECVEVIFQGEEKARY